MQFQMSCHKDIIHVRGPSLEHHSQHSKRQHILIYRRTTQMLSGKWHVVDSCGCVYKECGCKMPRSCARINICFWNRCSQGKKGHETCPICPSTFGPNHLVSWITG